MPLEATLPLSVVNVPGDYFSLAGFEVTMHGRFWVSPEVIAKTVLPSDKAKEWGLVSNIETRLYEREDDVVIVTMP